MKKSTAITTVAAALLVAVGGVSTVSALHKDVLLSLDGQVAPAGAFGTTVGDVLSANNVALGERDLVYPGLGDTVSDGETIVVQYSKQVTLSIDGAPVSFYTTATSLDDALSGLARHDLDAATFSVSRSMELPRAGLSVEVTTPKDVTLVVGGQKQQVTTLATTISDLLAEQGLTVESDDRIKPTVDTEVSDGLIIVLDRVDVRTKTRTEVIPFKTDQRKDSSLWKGETVVSTYGADGRAKRTYTITVVNGDVESKVRTAEDIVREPVTQVVKIGTKTTPDGVGLNLARASMWDRIARCESGNNWHINTGNGYYGGLQFNLASWVSNGGRDFAAYPHQASRAEQITVANRYYAKAGTRPWSCA